LIRLSIVSGGQTGVDRAALDLAIARGLPYSGWCPLGGRAEDFPHPPGLLAKYPNLRETPTADAEQRTAWNVRDSNATVIIGNLELSEGTLFTKLCAHLVYMRPCHVVDLARDDAAYSASHWLANLIELLRIDQFCLNFAGPRASESEGIYESAATFITKLLDPYCS
jgi:hypothetical protein